MALRRPAGHHNFQRDNVSEILRLKKIGTNIDICTGHFLVSDYWRVSFFMASFSMSVQQAAQTLVH